VVGAEVPVAGDVGDRIMEEAEWSKRAWHWSEDANEGWKGWEADGALCRTAHLRPTVCHPQPIVPR
jgi:hypothetical protein